MVARDLNAVTMKLRRAPTKKPSEAQYVQLPPDPDETLFEFQEEKGPQYVDAALQGVMVELGERDDDAKVTVKRLSVENGVRKEQWLYECHPREFSVPTLQEYYGAGDYRITVYGRQEGSNYRVVHADKKLSIGEPRGGAKKSDAFAGVPAPLPQPENLQRIVAESLTGPLTALTKAIAEMMPKQSGRAEVIGELTQLAGLMTTLRGAEVAPDPFAMLDRAIALMKTAAPASPAPLNEDGDISPNYILDKGIALVQTLMDAAKKPGAVPIAPALAAPAAHAAPVASIPKSAPISAAPEVPEDTSMKLALAMQLKFLLNAAVANSPTETYSALIYEQAPDDVIESLRGSDWFEKLCALEPGFAPFKPWAEKVRGEVLAELEADEAEAAAAELTGAPVSGITGNDAPASNPAPGRTPAD